MKKLFLMILLLAGMFGLSSAQTISGITSDTWTSGFSCNRHAVDLADDGYWISTNGDDIYTFSVDATSGVPSSEAVDSWDFGTVLSGSQLASTVYRIATSNYYVLAESTGDSVKIFTFGCSGAGVITKDRIDEMAISWDGSDANYFEFAYLGTNSWYVMTFSDASTGAGSIVSFQLNAADGTITSVAAADSDAVAAYVATPAICHLGSGWCALVYTGTGNDGYLVTVSTNTSTGAITLGAPYEYDTASGINPDIHALSGYYFLISYRGSLSQGYLESFLLNTATSNFTDIDISQSFGYDPPGAITKAFQNGNIEKIQTGANDSTFAICFGSFSGATQVGMCITLFTCDPSDGSIVYSSPALDSLTISTDGAAIGWPALEMNDSGIWFIGYDNTTLYSFNDPIGGWGHKIWQRYLGKIWQIAKASVNKVLGVSK